MLTSSCATVYLRGTPLQSVEQHILLQLQNNTLIKTCVYVEKTDTAEEFLSVGLKGHWGFRSATICIWNQPCETFEG